MEPDAREKRRRQLCPALATEDGDIARRDAERARVMLESGMEQHHVADTVDAHDQHAARRAGNRPPAGDQVEGVEQKPPPRPAARLLGSSVGHRAQRYTLS